MGLFKKKEEKKVSQYSLEDNSQIPQLPELPKLPEFPEANKEDNSEMTQNDFSLPQLPAYPNSSLGDKFSQNTIKEAVSGRKEVEEGDAEDFELDEEDKKYPMMQPPSPKLISQQNAIQNYSPKQYTTQKNPEPVFIRLDKFEESLEIFENAKEQISDIEHFLKEIKELKEKEDEELNSWENQMQEIKKQIEKVDQDIFSKI